MSEFVSRMSAQRDVLNIVNRRKWPKAALFGISQNAIHRWIIANSIPDESRLLGLLSAVAAKLNFLANRSQDQVSEAYLRHWKHRKTN